MEFTFDTQKIFNIDYVKSAEFENAVFDFNIFNNKKYISKVCKDISVMYDFYKERFEDFQKNNINSIIANGPFIPENAELTLKLTVECIRICFKKKIKYIIIPSVLTKEEYISEIIKEASEYGISILLKNECVEYNGRYMRGFGSNAGFLKNYIEKLNSNVGKNIFGICVDTGICNLCGQDIKEYITVLNKHIKAVIIRDNNGHNNTSVLPFSTASMEGIQQTYWSELVRGLRTISYDGIMIINISDSVNSYPPMLKVSVIRLAKETMGYLKKQIYIENDIKKYSSRVLFGAGNMFHTYMLCYGKKYPPLFTCDNNENLWDKEIYGVKVKAPESLKDIPEDCAIFICNILYYEEIWQQIRSMGLKNPVEIYNGDYAPEIYYNGI